MTKHHDTMTGYKATDKDMKCQGYQFKLGKWHKHEGPVVLCKNGFHFCIHPSGPWSYYDAPGTRIFKVEARDVHEEYTPGADLKVVCSEIRMIEEIIPSGNRNTGDSNTGYRNTGDWNTGDWNTGYSNTGDSNTGYSNTGDSNTGYRNTGDSNTGNWNTGNSNTGNWNATCNCAGFFCQKEPSVLSFDKQTELTKQEFLDKFPVALRLGELLSQDEPFDYTIGKDIPGWTLAKCKALHQSHIVGRKRS